MLCVFGLVGLGLACDNSIVGGEAKSTATQAAAAPDDPRVVESKRKIERLEKLDRDTVAELERARLDQLLGRHANALERYEGLLDDLSTLAQEGHNIAFGDYGPLAVYGDLLGLSEVYAPAAKFVKGRKSELEEGWAPGDRVDRQELETFIHLHRESEQPQLIGLYCDRYLKSPAEPTNCATGQLPGLNEDLWGAMLQSDQRECLKPLADKLVAKLRQRTPPQSDAIVKCWLQEAFQIYLANGDRRGVQTVLAESKRLRPDDTHKFLDLATSAAVANHPETLAWLLKHIQETSGPTIADLFREDAAKAREAVIERRRTRIERFGRPFNTPEPPPIAALPTTAPEP